MGIKKNVKNCTILQAERIFAGYNEPNLLLKRPKPALPHIGISASIY